LSTYIVYQIILVSIASVEYGNG